MNDSSPRSPSDPVDAGQNGSSPSPFPEASREAKLLAAAILEVLAGSVGPSDAARGLGISLARYYQVETRALAGLVGSCESRRRGRGRPGNELTALQRECEQLRRECARQQALMRATRRTVGLAPPAQNSGPEGRKRRRRPTARALKMVAILHDELRDGERRESNAERTDGVVTDSQGAAGGSVPAP